MSSRIEHYDNPDAPTPNRLIPAASAVVRNADGDILLIRRTDNGLWTIPGGAMEPGERIADCAIREVKEETGVDVEIVRLLGTYSDPKHLVEYTDGEVRQQFSICYLARPIGGRATPTDESSDTRWVPANEVTTLDMHPSIRLRLEHALAERTDPYLG